MPSALPLISSTTRAYFPSLSLKSALGKNHTQGFLLQMGNQMRKNLSNLPEQKVTSSIGAGVYHQLQTPEVQVSACKPASTSSGQQLAF